MYSGMDHRISRSPSPVVGKSGGKPMAYGHHTSLSRPSSRASSKASSRPSSRGSPYSQGSSILLSALHPSPPQPQYFNQLVPPLPAPAPHRISPSAPQHRISPMPPLSAIPMFQGPGLVNILPTQSGGLNISPEIATGISPSSQSTINPLSLLRPPHGLQLSDIHALNQLRHLPIGTEQQRIENMKAEQSRDLAMSQLTRERYAAANLLHNDLEKEKAHNFIRYEENRGGGIHGPAQTLEHMLKAGPAEINALRTLAYAHHQDQYNRHQEELKQQMFDEMNKSGSNNSKSGVVFQPPGRIPSGKGVKLGGSTPQQQQERHLITSIPQPNKDSLGKFSQGHYQQPLSVKTDSQFHLNAHLMNPPGSKVSPYHLVPSADIRASPSSNINYSRSSPYSHIPATVIQPVSQQGHPSIGKGAREQEYVRYIGKGPRDVDAHHSIGKGIREQEGHHSIGKGIRDQDGYSIGKGIREFERPVSIGKGARDYERPASIGKGIRDFERPEYFGPGVRDYERPASVGKGVRDYERSDSIGKGIREYERPASIGKGIRDFERPSLVGKGVRDYERPASVGKGARDFERPNSIGKGPREYERPASIGKGARDFERPTSIGKGPRDYERPASVGKGVREFERPASIGKGIREYERPASIGKGVRDYERPPSTGKGVRDYERPPSTGKGIRDYERPASTGKGIRDYERPPSTGKGIRDYERPPSTGKGIRDNHDGHNISASVVHYNQGSVGGSHNTPSVAVTVTTTVHTSSIQSVSSFTFSGKPVVSIGKPATLYGKPRAFFAGGKPASMYEEKTNYVPDKQDLSSVISSNSIVNSSVECTNSLPGATVVPAATNAQSNMLNTSTMSGYPPPTGLSLNAMRLNKQRLFQMQGKPAETIQLLQQQNFIGKDISQLGSVTTSRQQPFYSSSALKTEDSSLVSSSVSSHINSTAECKEEPVNGRGQEVDNKLDIEMVERQASLLNMRLSTLDNFPPAQTSYRATYRSQTMALHRAKAGSILTPAKSLDLLRQNLQKFINTELDSVVQKYMDQYFKPALKNIQGNSGLGAVSDDTILTLCSQILEEAKTMYTLDTRSVTPDDNVSEAGSISCSAKAVLHENKDIRATKHSLFNIKKRRGSSDSDASAKRRVKKPKNWSGISGRSTPSKKSVPDQVKRDGPKWDPEKITIETLFVMGSKANKALGLGNMRGRLYVKHPELFKYIGDQEDKMWLFENKKMPSTGGKAYLLVLEHVTELAHTDEYKNSSGVSLEDMVSFCVPQWMVDKMRVQMSAQRNDKGVKPAKTKAVNSPIVNNNQVDEFEDRIPFSDMYGSDKLLNDTKSDTMQDSPATDNLDLLSLDQEDLDTPVVSPFNMTGGFVHHSPAQSECDKGEERLTATFDFH